MCIILFKVFELSKVPETTEFGGVVKIIKNVSHSSQIIFGTFNLNPGESLVDDIHETDEVFYIVRGELTIKASKDDKSPSVAKEGQVVYIPKKTLHISQNQGLETVEVFWCNGDCNG